MNFEQKILFSSNGFRNETAEIAIQKDSILIKSLKKEIELRFEVILGVQFLEELPDLYFQKLKSFFYGEARIINEVSSRISRKPTGQWVIVYVEIERDDNCDIREPKIHQIYLKGDEISQKIVEKYNVDNSKMILFYVNPFSGTKSAPKLFKENVVPILKIAQISYEYVETHHKNHCRELVRVVDISKYRSLVTVSGDGLFHELLNGIMDRDDWKEAVKIPIGTISGGSANAMGKNFDTNNIILAVLNIINQQTRLMDVFSVIQNKSILYSHLTVSWTAIADIDIESEALRILGELRMTLMAIIRLTNVRMYKGVVYMLPVEEASNYKLKSPRENNYTGPKCKYTALGSTEYRNWPIRIESKFQHFLATNLPWISSDYLAAPNVKLNDGEIDVVFNTNGSLLNSIWSLLNSEQGKYASNIGHFKLKAFALEPAGYSSYIDSNDDTHELILNVSGERIPYDKIQVEIHPRVINMITPFWMDIERWARHYEENKARLECG